MAETKHPTINKEPLFTSRQKMDYLFSPEAYMQFPEKDSWRQRLLITLDEWKHQPDSYEPMQFFSSHNIPRKTFYEWCKKYPDVAAAFEEVKLELGMKRRLAATFNKNGVSERMILRDLHRYDPEEREIDKYHADLKVDQDDRAHTFKITINKPKVTSAEEMKKITEERE